MGRNMMQKITVALAGNPNVGKSTLINALTGLRQHTGNWPGKTVALARGEREQTGRIYEFVDLPGTYALCGGSPEQQIAGAFLCADEADCTVVVCDGTCLERNLILALQILEKTDRVVLCVNLMDEAQRRGIRIDKDLLQQELGIPVVLTAAGQGIGLQELMAAIEKTADSAYSPILPVYQDHIAAAEQLASACVSRTGKDEKWRQHLDRILTDRRHGIPILILMLLMIVWLTVAGANYPSRMLEALLEKGYNLLIGMMAAWPWWLRGILVDGVYVTAGRVICVMLPPMAIFFPLFTALEDMGYLPRMAFLLDHGMARCGGCGKQALTLCMGLGCNAVGVEGCRIIDSPRERTAAILTNAMVPCNGRFPTLILLGSLFFPGAEAALLVAACVALGTAAATMVSGVLCKTVLKGRESTFTMELPPLRRPRLGQILVRSLRDQTMKIALRALCVAAPAGAVLWILANTSLLSSIAAFLDPIGQLMGLSGVILLAFVLSLPANELLIPIVILCLSGGGQLREAVDVSVLLQSGWSWQTALCTMVFALFHWPCATTLLTIYHETKSMKKTAAAFFLPTAVGVGLCVMLRLILQELCA